MPKQDVKRVCYDCGEELTAKETAEGALAYSRAVAMGEIEDGYFRCDGPAEYFMQNRDEELKDECLKLAKANGLPYLFWEDGVIVCEGCIEKKKREEST